jgi:preprotein translocase subunit YajC
MFGKEEKKVGETGKKVLTKGGICGTIYSIHTT